MLANDVATMIGISVCTLHHYDKIGLLCPKRNPENEYRKYSNNDLEKLQQILFFKECGFSLGKIKELLDSPTFDKKKSFDLQEKYLLHERKRIDLMLETLYKTIQEMKGELIMSQKEKFSGFDLFDNPYEEEARKLWGDRVINQNNAHMEKLSEEEKEAKTKEMDGLFVKLATLRNETPSSQFAQAGMAEMYDYFNQNFGNQYTPEAFAGLGQMYITDKRFTKNIDKYGEGLSAFLAEAMGIYAKNK